RIRGVSWSVGDEPSNVTSCPALSSVWPRSSAAGEAPRVTSTCGPVHDRSVRVCASPNVGSQPEVLRGGAESCGLQRLTQRRVKDPVPVGAGDGEAPQRTLAYGDGERRHGRVK